MKLFWALTLIVWFISVTLHLVGFPIQDLMPVWAVWIWALSPLIISLIALAYKFIKFLKNRKEQ